MPELQRIVLTLTYADDGVERSAACKGYLAGLLQEVMQVVAPSQMDQLRVAAEGYQVGSGRVVHTQTGFGVSLAPTEWEQFFALLRARSCLMLLETKGSLRVWAKKLSTYRSEWGPIDATCDEIAVLPRKPAVQYVLFPFSINPQLTAEAQLKVAAQICSLWTQVSRYEAPLRCVDEKTLQTLQLSTNAIMPGADVVAIQGEAPDGFNDELLAQAQVHLADVFQSFLKEGSIQAMPLRAAFLDRIDCDLFNMVLQIDGSTLSTETLERAAAH